MDAEPNYFEPPRIDYRKLAAALDHYEPLGYTYIETPWVVSRKAIDATLPPGATITSVQYGDLVGSAEQGFIELILRGHTVLKACSISPCFRMEDSFDVLHHAYFMKLELISTEATEMNLQQMINDAKVFYEKYTRVDIIQTTPDAYDIVDRKRQIELGSYGIRLIGENRFIYGTGLALPRLDTAIDL